MRSSRVPRLVLMRFLLLVLFLVMLSVCALRLLLLWTAMTFAPLLRVVLSLLSARPIGRLLAMVWTVLLIVLLLRSVPLRGLALLILFARRLKLLWPAVLLLVLIGVT